MWINREKQKIERERERVSKCTKKLYEYIHVHCTLYIPTSTLHFPFLISLSATLQYLQVTKLLKLMTNF